MRGCKGLLHNYTVFNFKGGETKIRKNMKFSTIFLSAQFQVYKSIIRRTPDGGFPTQVNTVTKNKKTTRAPQSLTCTYTTQKVLVLGQAFMYLTNSLSGPSSFLLFYLGLFFKRNG